MECKKPENLDYVKIKSIKIKKLNGKWLVENIHTMESFCYINSSNNSIKKTQKNQRNKCKVKNIFREKGSTLKRHAN